MKKILILMLITAPVILCAQRLDKDFMQVAEYGWKGLRSMMTEDYYLKNVCRGTAVRPSLVYYYNRPTAVNGHHAMGALLLAGCELYKADAWYQFPWK